MSADLYFLEAIATAFESVADTEEIVSRTEAEIIDSLKAARTRGNLALILGAGVSVDSGILNWQLLVERAGELLFSAERHRALLEAYRSSQMSVSRKIRFCESAAGLKTAFRALLLKVLYEGFDSTRENPLLQALCTIMLGTDGCRGVNAAITYNFDNLLEEALKERIAKDGVKSGVATVSTEEDYRKYPDDNMIRVIHPHGYIPRGGEFGQLAKFPIVFSEDDYHLHFSNNLFWANIAQLETFDRAACLFVGLSFECPNMRRLLDVSRRGGQTMHIRATIMKLPAGPLQEEKKRLISSDLAAFDVLPIWVSDYKEIPAKILSIRA